MDPTAATAVRVGGGTALGKVKVKVKSGSGHGQARPGSGHGQARSGSGHGHARSGSGHGQARSGSGHGQARSGSAQATSSAGSTRTLYSEECRKVPIHGRATPSVLRKVRMRPSSGPSTPPLSIYMFPIARAIRPLARAGAIRPPHHSRPLLRGTTGTRRGVPLAAHPGARLRLADMHGRLGGRGGLHRVGGLGKTVARPGPRVEHVRRATEERSRVKGAHGVRRDQRAPCFSLLRAHALRCPPPRRRGVAQRQVHRAQVGQQLAEGGRGPNPLRRARTPSAPRRRPSPSRSAWRRARRSGRRPRPRTAAAAAPRRSRRSWR